MTSDQSGDDQPGLYTKYTVEKGGEPVEGCFVLEPATDPAARRAILAYAAATNNASLATDLRERARECRDTPPAADPPDGSIVAMHVWKALNGLAKTTTRTHELDDEYADVSARQAIRDLEDARNGVDNAIEALDAIAAANEQEVDDGAE